jgi:protein TonB
MLGGSFAVGSFVLAMNSHVRPAEKTTDEKKTEFVVERKARKPKPPPKKTEKPRRSPTKAPPLRLPDLGADLGLAGMPMPGIDASDLLAGGRDDNLDSLVMNEDSVDSPPEPRNRVAPNYPELARRQGIEGKVTARLLIGPDGEVERVKLVDSEPAGIFDELALASLERWVFQPATYRGQRVRVWARQTLEFRLD